MNTSAWMGAFIGSFIATILVPLLFFYYADRKGRSERSAIILRIVAVLIAMFAAWAGALGPDGRQHLYYIADGSVVAVLVAIVWSISASIRDHRARKEGTGAT